MGTNTTKENPLRRMRRDWLRSKRKAENKYGSGLLEILNKPFALWFLSSVGLAMISYLYTNFSACRASQNQDAATLQKLVSEMTGRAEKIQEMTADDNNDVILKQWSEYLDPGQNFVYLEYKDHRNVEITANIESILRKWNFAHADERQTASEEEKAKQAGLIRSIGYGLDDLNFYDQEQHIVSLLDRFEYVYSLLFHQMKYGVEYKQVHHTTNFSENLIKVSHYAFDLNQIRLSKFFHAGYCADRALWPF